ncbi:heat shock factor binding protein 1 domain-containing protein [Trichoderma ceciliae]
MNQGGSRAAASRSHFNMSSNRDSLASNPAAPNVKQNTEDSSADVTAAVEELLNSLSNKFAGVSSEIFAKMDEMSRRLDNLEAALLESKNNEAGSSSKSS